ncbi:MAG TPA: adenosylmethionine--8-amino-7-oxononanoate transaminase [Planctomycetaceae bacterium]|nr:adenosylmethionine--8-amino-7-oxononanoate transaminase [Planctomycetaceae bacterium]
MEEHVSPFASDIDLLEVDRQNYWHAFTQMAEYQPLIIESAQGSWLVDQQGRRLLDAVASMWCNVHGHRHPIIDAAIRRQLDQVAHVTGLGMSNTTSIRLTAKLVEIAPRGLECVFYSSDGASAVEVALKMAFQYWRQVEPAEPKRDLYMAIGGAYHGDTLGAVSVGGVARFHSMFSPLLFDVVHGPCPDSYRLPAPLAQKDWSGAELTRYYLKEYEQLLLQFGDRLAAVIVEPLIQAAAGMIMQPPGFLRGLAELARKHGALLIADEIAVGMGRTGRMWACQWEDVQPDMLCTGKGLSGGYLPIAATLTTRKIWNAFLGEYSQSRSFFHGHTYGGNPLACAAALATIELFDQEQTLQHVHEMSQYLAQRMEQFRSHPHVGDIRLRGLAGAIELVRDRESQEGFAWHQKVGHSVCLLAQRHGVWMRPLGNVLVLMPPLCITKNEVDFLVDAISQALEDQFG